jgi:hypothetical protein
VGFFFYVPLGIVFLVIGGLSLLAGGGGEAG